MTKLNTHGSIIVELSVLRACMHARNMLHLLFDKIRYNYIMDTYLPLYLPLHVCHGLKFRPKHVGFRCSVSVPVYNKGLKLVLV